jgi:hypothetical protein
VDSNAYPLRVWRLARASLVSQGALATWGVLITIATPVALPTNKTYAFLPPDVTSVDAFVNVRVAHTSPWHTLRLSRRGGTNAAWAERKQC